MATENPTGKTPAKPSGAGKLWVQRLLTVVGITAAVGGLLTMLTVQFGQQSGIEFCPQTFERRLFTQYRVPILQLPITKVTYSDCTGQFEQFVKNKKYLPTVKSSAKVWQTVAAQGGFFRAPGSDCGILLSYFGAVDANEQSVWEEWSEEHPQLAKKFWPAISQLAINDLYVRVPDLMDMARAGAGMGAKKFESELHNEVARLMLDEATRLQADEDHAAAVKLLEQGLKYSPSSEAIKQALATSKAAVAAQAKSEESTAEKK